MTNKIDKNYTYDALLSSLVDPLRGLTMWKCGRSWNLEPFPTSSIKGVERGVLEVPTRKRDKLLSYSVLHPKPTTSWLEFILHPFGVGTSHGRPWTHLTHHGPDSGEATTFPHIVFSVAPRGSAPLRSR